jgi:hypothetical protein
MHAQCVRDALSSLNMTQSKTYMGEVLFPKSTSSRLNIVKKISRKNLILHRARGEGGGARIKKSR